MSMRVGSCCQRIDRSSLSTIAAAGVGTVIGVAILTIGILAAQGIHLPPRPLFGLLSAETYLPVGVATSGVSLIFLFSQVIGQVISKACVYKKADNRTELLKSIKKLEETEKKLLKENLKKLEESLAVLKNSIEKS